MGFHGTFLVVRSGLAPGELVEGLAGVTDDPELDGWVLGWSGWRLETMYEDVPVEAWGALPDATGAPVLLCECIDSDFARLVVSGLPGEPWWWTYLHLESAAEYYSGGRALVRMREMVPDGQEAARGLLAWAEAAGVRPRRTVDELAALVDGHEVFVEETFFLLLRALGVVDLPDRVPNT